MSLSANAPVNAPVAGPCAELRVGSAAGRWVLFATILGSGLTQIDATGVGIALPFIGRDFHVDVAALQFVVSGYLLTLAGLLLLGGALGDRYGRRRIYLLGVIWFASASLLCAVAPNTGTLIAARVLQGVGAALLTPGSLAILQASFAPSERGRAIGMWSGFSGITSALGPVLGGYLISTLSWRFIFLINLPLAAGVVAVGMRHIPESADPDASGRIDILGTVLVTLGLLGLTYGLIEGPTRGWGVAGLSIALGVLALILFAFVERRVAHPLLPPGLFKSRQFTAANVVTFAVYGALGGVLFLLPVVLEQVAGFSPLETGAALLPVTVIMLLLSPRFGALATKIGPRLLMGAGPLIVAGGILLLTRVGPSSTYVAEVLPAVLIFGFGLSVTVAPLTSTVLAAAPVSHIGVASAVNNDVARAASLIAVAVLPAAAGITGKSYLHAEELTRGFTAAMRICAICSAAGGLLALAAIRNPRQPDLDKDADDR